MADKPSRIPPSALPSPETARRLALPVELLGLGGAVIAVMFAGRIVDMLIIPVVGVVAYYAGRWSARRD